MYQPPLKGSVIDMNELIVLLRSVSLFSELDTDTLNNIIEHSELLEPEIGSNISTDGCLPIVVSGKASIVKDNGVILRMLGKGDIFDVTSLFNDTSSSQAFTSSKVTAGKNCRVLMIPRSVISGLIHTNGDFAEKYICLLNEKIRFLNWRIRAFTADNVAVRLACHLLYLLDETPNDTESADITLGISLSKLASVLGIGRASLYRALDALEEAQLISHSDRNITVRNAAALRQWFENQ